MPIDISENPNLVFGTITIVFNHSFIDNIWKSLFDYERPNAYSDLIILFEKDNSIISKANIKDVTHIKLHDSASVLGVNCPKRFEIREQKYYAAYPSFTEGQYRLNLRKLFGEFMPNFMNNTQPSIYNCLYYHYDKNLVKIPVFGIIKQKHGYDSERYTFAYDYTKFTHEELAYIIKYIFFIEYDKIDIVTKP